MIITYRIKNYSKKQLSVYWIDYCLLILTSIIFIIIYIIYLIHYNYFSSKDLNNNDYNKRINNPIDLSKNFFSLSIIVSLTTMCLTIIGSLFFDAITAIKLSYKMNNIKKIIEKDLLAVSTKFKNIKINNILRMEYTYKYYIIFSIVNIIHITLCILAYTDTDLKRFKGYLNLYHYFTILLRGYHFLVLILLLFSIFIMNKRKKSLLRKYYFNPNRIAQKVYDAHFSQIVYYTDIISFKLVSDLIMNIPPLFFLSLEKFNTFTLIFSEFVIFLFIFLGGSENLILDKDNKAGIINKRIKFWFCFKQLDFHFGEKDHRNIFDEFHFNYSKEEQNILNDLNLTIIKNIEYNLIDTEDKSISEGDEKDTLFGFNTTNNNLSKFINTEKKIIDFKTVSEFYLIQKLIMLFFKTNKKVYESALDNMDDNLSAFRKMDKKNKRIKNNSQDKDNFIQNINRVSRMSTKDIKKIKPSIKISQNDIFTSVEEKEMHEELKKKLKLKNDKYIYKIESIFSSELFELFPFYQIKINSIISSLNPTRNIKIFNKFLKRNNINERNNFLITNKDDRLSIKNSINSSNTKGSIKELENNIFYTYDLYLMYEIYDKEDFPNFEELVKIINEYNAYLLSVIKNMNYTFLPLILGIFSLEIYDSKKIIILYRNPLYFTNFNHFNHWINFYITEEPEKIRVSSLFNDIIDVNEIEIRNTLQLNEVDYDEVKKNLENDYSFLRKIKNIYPIIHLFIGDEISEGINKEIISDEIQKKKRNQNHYFENSLFEESSLNKDIGLFDVLDKNLSVSNINNNDENEINNIMGENSLFDKEYYYMDGKQIRTIKIYFTNLFRKECELNKNSDNLQNKINSDSYCEFVQNQLIRYIKKNSLFNDEDKEEEEN